LRRCGNEPHGHSHSAFRKIEQRISISQSLQKYRIKLERRKAPFVNLVVDHMEKVPTPTRQVAALFLARMQRKGNYLIEKMWVGAYVDSARLEIERYFNLSLPHLGSDAQRRTAVPVQATERRR
jgi:hypothetical protein